jgi:hypothetical protein
MRIPQRCATEAIDQIGAVAGGAHAHGTDRGDFRCTLALRFGRHAGDRRDGSLHGVRRERTAARLETFAEPSDLGAIHDRRPGAVGVLFADVELDRVGPHVDDRVAHDATLATTASREGL